jgi:hypothetical protein
MVARMAGRTFIVRVSDAPRRVVIEDVRTQRAVVARDLAGVGACIAGLLDEAPEAGTQGAPAREDSVSAPP